jgi:tetratricopeptide (TPR) repeat protein
MCIIDTIRSSSKGRFGSWLKVLACYSIIFLGLGIQCSYAEEEAIVKAQRIAQEADAYYQQAISQYKSIIAKGKDLDRMYLELGKVYFKYGDFKDASLAFKNSSLTEAKKLLAISYYALGEYTDSLDVFNKNEIDDDETLYHKGLVCERLNLFDEALKSYRKIKSSPFHKKAIERIDIIQKESGARRIREVDPEVYKILVNAPAQEKYPQAGGIILSCKEKINVASDGTKVSSLHYIIKIFNERGKEEFSEAHINYDSTFEKVQLEYARTIRPDGMVVDIGSRHIRNVSKYLNFPLYSNARVFIISFPEITDGAVIEYKVKIYDNQLINKKDFVLGYMVQEDEPVKEAEFKVVVPKEKKLNIKTINERYNDFDARLAPKIEAAGQSLIYSWSFKDIPQIIPEANMPPDSEVNPAVLISTFSSWDEIYRWWWGLAQDKIKADSAIKDKVKALIKSGQSQEERARTLYNFCTQEIRYVAVEYGQAGYEPHFASDIFKNKYGDCKDQAILLVTMLREAGITAYPVLIPTKDAFGLREDFPSTMFNHCIAAVSLKDKVIFLDPTAETCSFGDLPAPDQGRKVLLFKEDSYAISQTPLFSAGHNLARQILKIRIDDDNSISAQKENFTYGVYDQAQRHWLLYTQPELIQEALKERIQDISIGSKLTSYRIENLDNLNLPVILSYAFKGPEYLISAGRLKIFPALTSLDSSVVAREKRRYPIDFGILDVKENNFEIVIPNGFVVKYMPESAIKECPWFKFSAEYTRHKNTLFLRQRTELKRSIVLAEEYPDFKKFFEGLAREIKQRIVLEREN